MNKKEVQSKRIVSLSWENKQGVSNKVTQTKFDYDHIQFSQINPLPLSKNTNHGMKIPPPPCYYERPPRLIRSSSRRGFKKQDDDPFYIAYKECTKRSRKGKVVDDLRNDDCFVGMKMNKNYMSSLFSCKHSCGVRDDSVVMINLSHIPISRSIREKKGGACTTRADNGPYLIYRRDGGDGHNLKSKLFGSASDDWSQNGNGELLKSHMGEQCAQPNSSEMAPSMFQELHQHWEC
ncbi:hypothetical protein BC332_31049 [Capsicum chinense]|nr:hypothetical protein BC332_31049 [Capsicum chinense]